MTPQDVGRLLAKAAAFDQRTVGDVDVLAWCEAIGDLDAADALAAVSRFYATVTERRIMPGDVRTLAAEIDRERRRQQREAIEAEQRPALDDRPLTDRRREIRDFVEQVRSVLPDTDPDVLRPRAAYWRREHAIHHDRPDEEPNPDFDPSMTVPVEWERSKYPPRGCWWQDESRRERHAFELLAEAGRLRPRDREAS